MTLFSPADAGEAQQIIASAAGERRALDIVAGGSKKNLGRPSTAEHTLDISALAGIIDYDPAELVLTAHAATPLAHIEALLESNRQMLAFEPPDWRAMLGASGVPTLGGVIACNCAGPRRVRAGAARDHFLGFAAINGFGDAWKAGGRVVKNVTGYDLCKLQAGAFGTLSLLTELSVRVMPRPETACTLLLHGLSDEAAITTLAQALNTPHEVSAAAHLPAAIARRTILAATAAVTAMRLEGPAPSVAFRRDALATLFPGATSLDAAETGTLWAEIGAVDPLLPNHATCIWRICPTPSGAPALLHAIRHQQPSAEAYYDWGGGLIWLSLDANLPDGGAAIVRRTVQQSGGHATLVVAPDAIRLSIPVFEPDPAPLAALAARIKAGFDPNRILNPGRMREGQ
jgi:glycolate oxidase FAD binding subunit